MRHLNISEDIIPVGEFKTHLAKCLKTVNEKRSSIVITQNGRPAGVLIAPAEYDAIQYVQRFTESVSQGMQQADFDDTFTTIELKKEISKHRSIKQSK